MKKLGAAIFLSVMATFANAAAPGVLPATQPSIEAHIGLGQDAANQPVKIKNLGLGDPLIQQKYLNDPDMIRFLRQTYSDACARGLVNEATKSVKYDIDKKYTPDQRTVAGKLLDSQHIWGMTAMEMEALFGDSFMNAAFYCRCIMKEVPDTDLVNPRKGLDVVEKLSKNQQQACERIAKDQVDKFKKTKAKTAQPAATN